MTGNEWEMYKAHTYKTSSSVSIGVTRINNERGAIQRVVLNPGLKPPY